MTLTKLAASPIGACTDNPATPCAMSREKGGGDREAVSSGKSNGIGQKLADAYRIATNRVWRSYLGGRTLDCISGITNPQDSHFPEDWLLSDTLARNVGREQFAEEGISLLKEPDGTLIPFTRLLADYPQELLGQAHCQALGHRAGFLLKYLDAAIRLHIQCHPSVPFARRFLNSDCGKTEGYYILGVRPECEGYLYLGFQRAPSPAQFKEAVAAQDTAAILGAFDKIPVRRGDCFIVPGGVPHAIGEGVFMVEMMEPTDFAVRVEFERGGYVLPEAARFMGRGIDFAMSMFEFLSRNVDQVRHDFFVTPQPLPIDGDAQRFSLIDSRKTDRFRLERMVVDGEAAVEHDSLRALMVISGSGTIECGRCRFSASLFDRFLVPWQSRLVRISGKMELLAALPRSIRP